MLSTVFGLYWGVEWQELWSFFPLLIVWADISYPRQFGFQDPATVYFEGIIDLHHDLLLYMIVILVFVFYMLVFMVWRFHNERNVYPPADIRYHSRIETI
jgi:heme/copper-type cytochrome/quinol oxidase subunit 2